jgi:uncharacterized membrane protein
MPLSLLMGRPAGWSDGGPWSIRVDGSVTRALESAAARYEHLRRLAERHEFGELSDADFKQLRQWMLRRGATTDIRETGVFELMVASYSDPTLLRATLAVLRAIQKDRRGNILDAAISVKEDSGAIRVRVIGDLTRRVAAGQHSIIAAACGLLFPPASLVAADAGTSMDASFDWMAAQGVFNPALRAMGDGLAPGNSAIVAITWESSADAVAASFHGFDSFTRLVLRAIVANEILDCLIADDELRDARSGD